MKVTLNQEEIFTAIENYILETVRVGEHVRLDMDLAATRGAEGYTATVSFVDVTNEEADTKDQVIPTEASKAEGLSIVTKIEDARAKAPRRSPVKAVPFREGTRAEPPKQEITKGETQTDQQTTTNAVVNVDDTVVEHKPPVKVEAPVEQQLDIEDVLAEQTVDSNVSATNEELIAQAEPLNLPAEDDQKTEAQEEAPVEAVTEPEPAKVEDEIVTAKPAVRSLFGAQPAPQTEEELAAEATQTEPEEEEEVDYTPTPETPGLPSDDAHDEAQPAPVKTRSLFGDLKKSN